ncbi:hypothetical protein Tco_0957009, partial [Tanacetum coccineum]
PEYPEYLVPSEDEVPIEDQSLPDDASPIALSPGYVVDSDLEVDLEEDPKEDPADYPADEGVDKEDESSEDDDDDEEDEEEHLAPTNSATATPPPPQTIILVFMTHHHRARISVRPHTPPSPSTEAIIVEYASALPPSPPPSPLSPLSSPLLMILSSPLHNSPTYAE